MSSSTLSHIVTRMQTEANTTLGWDVVVSYTETELNKLLAVAYDEDSAGNKAIKQLECSLKATDDFTGDDYTINYTFDLGPPLIKFIDTYTSPVCSLTVPILGGKAEIPSATTSTQSFGGGVYTLGLNNLELASANGGATSTASDNPSVEDSTSSDKPFVFPPSSNVNGIVYIDFEASSTNLLITLTSAGTTGHSALVDNHMGDLKEAIRNQFLITYKHVVYELARTNNSKPNGGDQLVPKSFMFATHAPDNGETILSLFIQTGNTNNGLQSRLNSNWDSLWGTELKCPPIPSGKTASVILSKNTIFTAMIEPGLERQGYSSQLDNTKGSIQLQVNTKKEIHEPEYKVEHSSLSGTTYHTAINMVLPDLQLTLQQDPNQPAYCRGSWTYSYKFDWETHDTLPSRISIPGTQGIVSSHQNGTVTVTNDLAEDTYPVTLGDEYTLKMNYQIRKEKWNVKTVADKPNFWEALGGAVGSTPSWAKDINVALPKMSIDLGSLNYFLTTNLLLPSRKVIDIDTNVGVQVPGDFYLVGSVEEN